MQNDNEYVKLSDVIKYLDYIKNNRWYDRIIKRIENGINKLHTFQCISWHPGSEPPTEEKKYLCRFKFEGQDEIRRDCIPWRNYDNGPHWITHGTKMIVLAWADVSSETESCI
jgi:hypothetical protein